MQSLLSRVAPDHALSISDEGMAQLMRYPFSGNIRELRNVLERLTLLCEGDVATAAHVDMALGASLVLQGRDAGAALPAATTSSSLLRNPTLRESDNAAFLAAVSQHRGTKAELAAKLGISERSLYRRLKELQLPPLAETGPAA
ncbi:Alginate biosynthesis transcriptional regulatory protein AlgB [compost metagenome]